MEIAVYFVVSEALANVAKYANATEATVAVRRTHGHVEVEITDDGVGGADAGEGVGLRGLADRVAALDGTLSRRAQPVREPACTSRSRTMRSPNPRRTARPLDR